MQAWDQINAKLVACDSYSHDDLPKARDKKACMHWPIRENQDKQRDPKWGQWASELNQIYWTHWIRELLCSALKLTVEFKCKIEIGPNHIFIGARGTDLQWHIDGVDSIVRAPNYSCLKVLTLWLIVL